MEGHVQIIVEESRIPLENTPLLKIPDQTQEPNSSPDDQEDDKETHLDKTLQRLYFFLSFLGFNQSSVWSFVVSWGVFLVIGVLLPVVMLELSNCPGCEKGQIKSFEIGIVVSQACLAAASMICLSHNLRKYGVRKFLFVDRHSGHVERFSGQYVQKISDSIRTLVLWVFACCLLKTAREIIRIMYVHHEAWWQSVLILLAFVFSWTYVTTIILSACVVFHVVCNLQIIHFDDYGKLLEREPDVVVLLQEHARLRFYLSKISHRFRIYLLLQFVIVTICQFITLFQTTGYNGMITFINGGDFAVSSIVQVVGIILCLNAAAKISHRAQGIGAVASRWHALMTCSATDASQLRTSNSIGSLEAASKLSSFHVDYSESDLESLDFVTAPTNVQLASYMSSYHKRLALGKPRRNHDFRVDSGSRNDQYNILHPTFSRYVRAGQDRSLHIRVVHRRNQDRFCFAGVSYFRDTQRDQVSRELLMPRALLPVALCTEEYHQQLFQRMVATDEETKNLFLAKVLSHPAFALFVSLKSFQFQ